MQNWEEQRELFLQRLRSGQRPPARPRLRPNMFARLARFAINRVMTVLLAAAFLVTAAVTLAALGARFDLARPVEIGIDAQTRSAQAELQAEFPLTDSLMIVRVSAENSGLAQTAAQAIAAKLEADQNSVRHVFTPGLGAYYDRFGILYLDPAEIAARVDRVKRLRPLFQAIAASPNLAGLSALVNQVAEAVQQGRSPRGLETLFQQMSATVKGQVAGKAVPMDWQRFTGLKFEAKSREWVVVVHPVEGRHREAMSAIETLTASISKSQPALKVANEFPPEARDPGAGSPRRQIVIGVLLSVLFLLTLVVTTLRSIRSIVLFTLPSVVSIAAAFAAAFFSAGPLDQVGGTLVFAAILPVMGYSLPLVEALSKPGATASATSRIMLAAHEAGLLLLALAGMALAVWLFCAILGMASLARLSATIVFATLTGLATALLVVPALASLMPQPPDDPPPDFYDLATTRNLMAIWHKLRPPLTGLIIAASFFCVVFFLSLNFSTARPDSVSNGPAGAGRGLQFMVEDEAAATKLVDNLQQLPEVGTVRWMGTFLPQQAAQKQEILRGLGGVVAAISNGSSVGPYDLVENLRGLETGLRVISDGAGTDEGLRSSAHEFRRALALLTNTSQTPEAAAVELERLLFSGFGGLAKSADELSRLAAPKLSDLEPNLRALYVSGNGRWRVEALPRRAISANAFIDATRSVDDRPLGPLVVEQAELRTLQSSTRTALSFGFAFSLLVSLAYLRNVPDWLIVVASSLLLLPVYAALIVTTGTAISPVLLPAIIMSLLFAVTLQMLLVAQRREPRITALSIFLPAAATIAVVLPIRFLHLQELESFAGTLIMLLAAAVLFSITVVPQICAWVGIPQVSGPRLNEKGLAPQPREYLDDDIL